MKPSEKEAEWSESRSFSLSSESRGIDSRCDLIRKETRTSDTKASGNRKHLIPSQLISSLVQNRLVQNRV